MIPYALPPKERHHDVIVARERAHAVFDLLWRCEYMSRDDAYSWLQQRFNKPPREAHIGRFSIEECAIVEKAVADWLSKKSVLGELSKQKSRADQAQQEVTAASLLRAEREQRAHEAAKLQMEQARARDREKTERHRISQEHDERMLALRTEVALLRDKLEAIVRSGRP